MNSRLLICAGILALIPVTSCREDESPWPVWILYAYAIEHEGEGVPVPVQGCPSVTWRYEGASNGTTTSCREHNLVKVWEHIDNTVTIVYRINCAGYFSSADYRYTFDMDSIRVLPGRDGPEVICNTTVLLNRHP